MTIEEIKQRIAQAAATNRNPLYDSHLYWAQKPYNICDLLIEAFSQPGDLHLYCITAARDSTSLGCSCQIPAGMLY